MAKDLDLKLAEAYARALAIHSMLADAAEKGAEDSAKKTSKTKDHLAELKINFSVAFDGVSSLRDELDTQLEYHIVTNRNLIGMETALRKLSSLRSKMEAGDFTATNCTKWLEELGTVKTSLEKRFEIKKVDSERQATVASLTEQLKKKEETIEKLTQQMQTQQGQIEQLNIDLKTLQSRGPENNKV